MSSYTPTNWQDYPGSRATPITAAELNRIDNGVADIYDRFSAFPKKFMETVFSDFAEGLIRVEVSETASLQEDNPYYDISTFYPKGLLAYRFRNSTETYLPYTTYTLTADTTRIYFNTTFETTDILRLYFFHKPYVSSSTVSNIWTGTQAQYDALSSYDSNTLYVIEEVSS